MMETKGKALRVPILVDRDIYDKFKDCSKLTGIPVSRLVRDAMAGYEVTLEARLKTLKAGVE